MREREKKRRVLYYLGALNTGLGWVGEAHTGPMFHQALILREREVLSPPKSWERHRRSKGLLTQGVSRHPREDDAVCGKEDSTLSWKQSRAPSTASYTLLTPIWQQIHSKAIEDTLLTGQ